MVEAPQQVPRSEWEYRLLIRMPGFVTTQEIQSAAQTVVTKKQLQLANEVEFFRMSEGQSVQILHVGPFAQEPETLKQKHAFMQANNLVKKTVCITKFIYQILPELHLIN